MEKLQAQLIIEILGRPPEHIKEALQTIILRMNAEEGVKVLEKTIHEPKPVENSKDLYTTFADILIELNSVEDYINILFTYLPAHADLIYPESIEIRNDMLNIIGNKILQRIHEYDAITKNIVVERDLYLQKLKEVAPHLFKKKEPEQQTPPKKPEKNIKKKPNKQKPIKKKK